MHPHSDLNQGPKKAMILKDFSKGTEGFLNSIYKTWK